MHDNMDGRFLGVLHGGAQLAFSWDGTSEDAERVIDLAAENRAENLSTDYWVKSGWRT